MKDLIPGNGWYVKTVYNGVCNFRSVVAFTICDTNLAGLVTEVGQNYNFIIGHKLVGFSGYFNEVQLFKLANEEKVKGLEVLIDNLTMDEFFGNMLNGT